MPNKPQSLLITGSAGFIGSNLVLRLLDSEEPLSIVGLDNLNDYYDPSLKEWKFLRKLTPPCSYESDPRRAAKLTPAA